MADQAQERWLTYAEVGELLGCTASAARARAQRHGWPRRGANAIGGYTKVLVPENLAQNVDGAPPVRRNTSGAYGTALVNGAAAPHGVALDPAHVAALVAPLEGAVAALATQLHAANEQLGIANRRIDELQQRIDGLYTDLADARTAAMISGCEAATLRSRLALRGGDGGSGEPVCRIFLSLMSRGLGIEQRTILQAAAARPWWGRMDLQQAAWGKRAPQYGLTVPEGIEPRRWVKNVRWWRNGKELTEGNFTRALQSLEKRGLLSAKRKAGCHTTWMITAQGLAMVEQLSDAGS